MKTKTKKKLIIALSIIIILVGGTFLGVNIYVDSVLNKMNQKNEFSNKAVNAKNLEGDVENIALLGVDATGGDGARTDVMKIISLNFDDKKIKINSIQRDNLVYLPMKERYEKLNHAYMYDDVQGTLAAMNYSFDLDITKYVKFSFDSVEQIADILGGVDLSLTAAEAGELGVGGAGVHHLNGRQTLAYTRIRDLDSDYGRMQRQNNVINSITGSVSGKSPFELLDIVNSIMPYIETNVSNGTIKSYATSLLSFDLGGIEQFQFPSEGYSSIIASLYLYGYGPHYVLKDYTGEVELLHKNIYNYDYKASKTVKQIDKDSKAMAQGK